MVNASDFDRRITLKAYDYTQNSFGAPVRDLKETVTIWAKVTQKSGFTNTQEAQQQSQSFYEIFIRYQAKFNSNWVIEYENMELKIDNIKPDDEGNKRFMIIKASVTIRQEDWS